MIKIGGITYTTTQARTVIQSLSTKGQLISILEPNQRLVLLTCAKMCGKTELEMLQAFVEAFNQLATEEEVKIAAKTA